MPELKQMSAQDDAAAIVAELTASGGVIIEGLLDASLLDQLNREARPEVQVATMRSFNW